MDLSAVAFGGFGGGQLTGGHHCLALFRQFEAQFAAFIRFAIECLGNRSGTPHVADGHNFDKIVTAVVPDLQTVALMNLASRFRVLPIRLDAAKIAGMGCEGARFEESGSPKPLVDSNAGHAFLMQNINVIARKGKETRRREEKYKLGRGCRARTCPKIEKPPSVGV
jgi:hypothetical protein